MTDYTKAPRDPWTKELCVGDLLSGRQADQHQDHRLRDFGLKLRPHAPFVWRVCRIERWDRPWPKFEHDWR